MDWQLKTQDEIAALFRVSRRIVDRWRRDGVPVIYLNPNSSRCKHARFNPAEVAAWLQERNHPARGAAPSPAQTRRRKACPEPAPAPTLDPLAEFDPEAGLDDIDASCLADEHADGREVEA